MKSSSLRNFSGQATFAAVGVIVAILAALLGASGWWCYGKLAEEAFTYRNYKSLQRNAGRADSLATAYDNALREIAAIRKAMPPQNQASHVLNSLTEAARGHDLGLSEVNALDEVPFPGFTELPFEISVAGGFPDLVGYLHTLETQGMVLRVRRLAIKNESLNKPDVQARLELSVFVPGGRGSRNANDTASEAASSSRAAP